MGSLRLAVVLDIIADRSRGSHVGSWPDVASLVSHRVEAGEGDLVVVEWLEIVVGIVDGSKSFRGGEDPVPHVSAWNVQYEGAAETKLQALIVGEEECLIADDRASDGAAKLV